MLNLNTNENAINNNSYNLTKMIFLYSLVSIILIVIFIISPLNLFLISPLMKILIVIILSYTFYLNIKQINILRNTTNQSNDPEIASQINTNIITSYIFSLFIGVLIIFVIRRLF
jgi:hypothetical protein